MGSPFNIVFYSTSVQKADSVANESFKLVDSINSICSDYDTSSELYKLRRYQLGKPMKVSSILFQLLIAGRHAYKDSYGSFDITIGPLSLLWRSARKSHIFPSHGAIDSAKLLVDFRNIYLDPTSQSITFLKPGIQLDMGGIAKGYAADKVAALLKFNGLTNSLVVSGGDMMAMGSPHSKNGLAYWYKCTRTARSVIRCKALAYQ